MSQKLDLAKNSYRNEPRRSFTWAFKRQLVETLLASPDSMARVARDNHLNQNQLAKWRVDYQAGLLEDKGAACFLPVAVIGHAADRKVMSIGASRSAMTSTQSGLELILPKGRVVVHGISDTRLLRDVILAMQ